MRTQRKIKLVCLVSIIGLLSGCQRKTEDKAKYIVNFHTDGGTAIANQTILDGELVTKPEDPIKTDYVFENWYTESTFVNVYNFSTPVHSNFSLYAKYNEAPKYFTVTFESNGGTLIPTQTVKDGELVTKPEDPIKTDYVFENWYTEQSFTNVYDFSTPVHKNLSLYAKYNVIIKYFTVTFDSNGGTLIPNQVIQDGGLVTKPDNPVLTDYIFENWYTESTLENVYDFSTPVHSNFSLYAKYVEASNYYIVTFDSNGGTPVESQIVEKGNKVIMPHLPKRDGYMFNAWYIGEEEFDFDTIIISDITLVANWKEVPVDYIVSVNPVNGGAYDVRNDKIKDFVDNFEKEYSSKYKSHGDQFKNNPLVLSWNTSSEFDSYIVDISSDRTFKSYESYACSEKHVSIENVLTDQTYYWQVSCVDNGQIKSCGKINSVYVNKAPRLVNVDSITNTRDIGGMYVGNKRIRQGMAFRSARLDDISEKGKDTLIKQFGVKTEIELRSPTEISPIGANLISVAFPWWTGSTANGIDNPSYWPAVKTAVEAFANKNNYPIDFHCSIGQDRTGTLAILIEGLCGASMRDIFIDYELTSFSSVTDGDDPVGQSIHNKYYYQVDPLISYLKSFGDESDTFQTCVINFLTGTIGVSSNDITAIQNILLEDR